MFNNRIVRKDAKQAFKRRWPGYLGLSILMSVVVLVVSMVLFGALGAAGVVAFTTTEMPSEGLEVVKVFLPKVLMLAGAGLLVALLLTLISGALEMGLWKGIINMVRGEKAGAGVLFSRLKKLFGCFLLKVWVGFKTFLWMLPGYLLIFLGLAVLIAPVGAAMTDALSGNALVESVEAIMSESALMDPEAMDPETMDLDALETMLASATMTDIPALTQMFMGEEMPDISALTQMFMGEEMPGAAALEGVMTEGTQINPIMMMAPLVLANVMESLDASLGSGMLQGVMLASLMLVVLGMILTAVLVVAANLRYMMSAWFYADDPSCGVLGAVRLSKKAMKGRKWQMIRLMLLYIFRAFLMILLGALVLTLVITLVCSLLDASQDVMYLLVYGAVTVFMLVASFIASGRYVFAQAAFYNRSTEEISKQY